MTGAADLEKRLTLVLELNLFVVDSPRGEDAAIDVEERVSGRAVVRRRGGGFCLPFTVRDGALHQPAIIASAVIDILSQG